MHPKKLAAPLLCLLLTSAVLAQTITPIVVEGDALPAVGLVTRIDHVQINDNGLWLVEVDTDFPDSNADGAIIRGVGPNPGLLFAREGENLVSPAGTQLGGF
jgi:hypothetical protein